MKATRQRDTGAEIALRSELHARGLRYRVHRRIVPGVRREADVVFGPTKVAVFVDGCFWHCCPIHGSMPRANARWWREKLEKNERRDRDTDRRLQRAGWKVVRVWEHDDPRKAADRVRRAVLSRRSSDRQHP